MSSTLWFRVSYPKPQARLRLFCLPYAGGAAAIYRNWPQSLPDDIEVCAIQLPGRENRIREQPFNNLVALVQVLLPNLLPYLDKPFALFGHSMGSLIAYELAQQLQSHDQTPTQLFVSGRRAPILSEPAALLHTIPSDEAFLTALQQRYNNLPAVLLAEAELRALFVPLLRADMTLVETYQYRARPALSCPLVALGGAVDPFVSPAELQAWPQLTQADFAVHFFPGGHFYLNEQMQPLLATIASCLA